MIDEILCWFTERLVIRDGATIEEFERLALTPSLSRTVLFSGLPAGVHSQTSPQQPIGPAPVLSETHPALKKQIGHLLCRGYMGLVEILLKAASIVWVSYPLGVTKGY